MLKPLVDLTIACMCNLSAHACSSGSHVCMYAEPTCRVTEAPWPYLTNWPHAKLSLPKGESKLMHS
jgi:hypothetical protein